MNDIPWISIAAPYRDEETRIISKQDYSSIRSMLGKSDLKVPEHLGKIGCRAFRMIVEGRNKVLTVTIGVIGPDGMSMTVDGFTITPKNKITLMYSDNYDD